MPNYGTIGGLRDALSKLNGAASIYIDDRRPTALSSYRGYYDQLAIERRSEIRHERTALDALEEPFELNMAGYDIYSPGHSAVSIKADPTVADLIEALDLAVGTVFEGYKGGQYVMRLATDLWVSEYGGCDSLRIDAINASPARVNLTTREEEF